MNPADAYRKTAVETSDSGKVIVALYDEFLKNCHIARRAFEEGDRSRAGEAIDKALAIVKELHASLDPELGDEDFAERLSDIYIFVNESLLEISISNDPDELGEIIELMGELRDAWSEAAGEVGQRELAELRREHAGANP